MDPTDPDLILAGVGMNFYPKDYAALLEVLTEHATAQEKASPRRKKRKVEGARHTFTKNCYFTTLQHVCDGAELTGNGYCSRKAMTQLLEGFKLCI